MPRVSITAEAFGALPSTRIIEALRAASIVGGKWTAGLIQCGLNASGNCVVQNGNAGRSARRGQQIWRNTNTKNICIYPIIQRTTSCTVPARRHRTLEFTAAKRAGTRMLATRAILSLRKIIRNIAPAKVPLNGGSLFSPKENEIAEVLHTISAETFWAFAIHAKHRGAARSVNAATNRSVVQTR